MSEQNLALLGLASNSPDCGQQMQLCIDTLRSIDGSLTVSPAYKTRAVSQRPVPDYLNAVARIRTTDTYEAFHARMKEIETQQGRTPLSKQTGIIPIDIDIVVWNDEVMRPRDLQHEYMQKGLRMLGIEING